MLQLVTFSWTRAFEIAIALYAIWLLGHPAAPDVTMWNVARLGFIHARVPIKDEFPFFDVSLSR